MITLWLCFQGGGILKGRVERGHEEPTKKGMQFNQGLIEKWCLQSSAEDYGQHTGSICPWSPRGEKTLAKGHDDGHGKCGVTGIETL